jgi:O-antigen/teichoic acid export membrane protein
VADATKGIGRKTRQAVSWTAATAILSNIARIVVLAILGRLLAPQDFGVVAAAMTVIMFVSLLRDFGVGLALVQRQDLEPEHIEVAFTMTVIQGFVLTAIVALTAGPIADFFEMEHSTDIVRALSVLFVLRSVAIVPNFMLQREMRFRALSLIDVGAYLVGATTSIVLAFTGAGAWSLVIGYAVETALGVAAMVYLAPPPPRLRWHRRHLRELLGFGIGKSLANLANYFATQGDYMVIGRVLDKTQLGLYQRAYELVRFPSSVFRSVAGSVLFSAFAKVQNDPERMGRVFRRTTFATAIVLLPASMGLIVLAPEVIRILMGAQWDGAVWPFRIMALTMLFRTTTKLGGLVGRSSGEMYTIAKWQVIYAILVIGGAAISVRWGIMGVSCTTAFALAANYLSMTAIGLRMTTLGARDIVRAHVAPLAFALVVGALTFATAAALRAADASHVIVAGVATAVGSAAFVGMLMVALRRGTGDWPWLKETFVEIVRKKTKKKRAKAAAVAESV